MNIELKTRDELQKNIIELKNRNQWPKLIKEVVERIEVESEGFNFKVTSDINSGIFRLESPGDFYLNFTIKGSSFIVKDIRALEEGQGYGQMLMSNIIKYARVNGISTIIADNTAQTDVAKHFWSKLNFSQSTENKLSWKLELK